MNIENRTTKPKWKEFLKVAALNDVPKYAIFRYKNNWFRLSSDGLIFHNLNTSLSDNEAYGYICEVNSHDLVAYFIS